MIELLVTCSVLPEMELYADLIPPSPQGPPTKDTDDIRSATPDGKEWLLKREDCPTYFVRHDLTFYGDG